jgi:hypothetical protein
MNLELTKKTLDELTPEEWALVLASIGTRKKRRPIDPVTLAELFVRSTSWTNEKIAKRVSTTPRTVIMFKHLLRHPEEIKALLRAQKISIDEGDRLSSLKEVFAREFLAKAIADNTLTADLIKKIVRLKNRNPDMPIENCIDIIQKSKPIVETRHIFVTSIEKTTSKALNEKAEQGQISPSDLLRKILEGSLPNSGSLLSIVIHNGTILLILTSEGLQALRQKSAELKVPLNELLEALTKQFEVSIS